MTDKQLARLNRILIGRKIFLSSFYCHVGGGYRFIGAAGASGTEKTDFLQSEGHARVERIDWRKNRGSLSPVGVLLSRGKSPFNLLVCSVRGGPSGLNFVTSVAAPAVCFDLFRIALNAKMPRGCCLQELDCRDKRGLFLNTIGPCSRKDRYSGLLPRPYQRPPFPPL